VGRKAFRTLSVFSMNSSSWCSPSCRKKWPCRLASGVVPLLHPNCDTGDYSLVPFSCNSLSKHATAIAGDIRSSFPFFARSTMLSKLPIGLQAWITLRRSVSSFPASRAYFPGRTGRARCGTLPGPSQSGRWAPSASAW
jgi:hypothetical protein